MGGKANKPSDISSFLAKPKPAARPEEGEQKTPPVKKKPLRTSLGVDPEKYEDLKVLAAYRMEKIHALLDEALAEYLARNRQDVELAKAHKLEVESRKKA